MVASYIGRQFQTEGYKSLFASRLSTVCESNVGVTIQIMALTTSFNIHGRQGMSTLQLAHMIHTRSGIPLDQIRLVFNGTQLQISHDKILYDYNIRSGDTIHLVLRLRGGCFLMQFHVPISFSPKRNAVVSQNASICFDVNGTFLLQKSERIFDQLLNCECAWGSPSSQHSSFIPHFARVAYDSMNVNLDVLVYKVPSYLHKKEGGGVVQIWNREKALLAAKLIEMHRLPCDLAKQILDRLRVQPSEFESLDCVPVPVDVRVEDQANPTQYLPSVEGIRHPRVIVRPTEPYWPPHAHLKVVVLAPQSSPSGTRLGAPFPTDEEYGTPATTLQRLWHFYTNDVTTGFDVVSKDTSSMLVEFHY